MTNEEWLISHGIEEEGVRKVWLDAYNTTGKVLREIKYHGQDYYSGDRFVCHAGKLWRKGLVCREYRELNGEPVMTLFLNQLPNKHMKDFLPIHIPTNEDALRMSIPFWNPNTYTIQTEDLWTVVPHDKRRKYTFVDVDDWTECLMGAGFKKEETEEGYVLVNAYRFGYGIDLGVRFEFFFDHQECFLEYKIITLGDVWHYPYEIPLRVKKSLYAFKNDVTERLPFFLKEDKKKYSVSLPGNAYFDRKAAQFFRRKFNEAGVDPKEGLIKQRFFGKTDLYTMYWSFESKTGNRYVLEFDYDIEAPQRMSIPSPFVECIRTKYKLFSGRSSRILPTQEEAWEWIEEALKEG